MAALFNVVLRPTKAISQEIAQALFGRRQIAPPVHGAENVVGWNLPVKRCNEPRKTVISDGPKNFVFFHQTMLAIFQLAARTPRLCAY